MGFLELMTIAVGLSMDAFAVSLCKGLSMQKLSLKNGAVIALYFGGFQALMPLLGWLLGRQFQAYITSVDHWIAFVLLGFIGGKMIAGAFEKDEKVPCPFSLDHRELFMLAVATSIDALAVGVTFAFLHVAILPSVCLIGAVTFALSLLGVAVGHRFGVRLKKKAELLGGGMLCLIGLKILLDHLGIL